MSGAGKPSDDRRVFVIGMCGDGQHTTCGADAGQRGSEFGGATIGPPLPFDWARALMMGALNTNAAAMAAAFVTPILPMRRAPLCKSCRVIIISL